MVKIMGREIDIGRIANFAVKNPQASIIGLAQRVRQKTDLDFFLNGGYSLPPTTITIEVTYSCNLRCKTCWFYGNKGILGKNRVIQYLSLRELKKIVDNIAWFRPYIYLTGGEPLLNKEIYRFISYAKKKGLAIGLVTNGTLLNRENAKKLVESGIDFITISLDGPEKIHNKIRGSKCFKKTVEGITNLIKERESKKLPIITLNCTISDFNYLYLEDIVRLGENIRADIVALQHPCFLRKNTIALHHAIFGREFGESNNLVDGYENNSALKIDFSKLNEIIQKIKEKQKKVKIRLYQDFSPEQIKKYYETEAAVNNRCVNPWFAATIKPNGDVTPCLGYVVGNIKNEKFSEIWNNHKFQQFRKVLKQKKYFPGCIRCCGFFYNW
jgi:MoaA/NifB/PqqE/SkfB family radical SAM enzyme